MSGQDLVGRTALVTGGASGIGAAIAEQLAGRGARVRVADLNGPAAEAVAGALGGEAWAIDLSDTTALVDLRLDIDILVNNVGIQHVAPIEDFDPDVFHRILMIMVEAPFLLVRAALPAMYARGFGRILQVSSVHGLRASPYKSAYVTAKHALEGLEKVLLARTAIKRLVEPKEVASLVGWLTGPHAGMVTGASYTMDGGWSAQ